MIASYCRYRLVFAETAITSRSSMNVRDTWFVRIFDPGTGRSGVGECAVFAGLSSDDVPDYGQRLEDICRRLNRDCVLPDLTDFPSLRIGLEMAMAALDSGEPNVYFPSTFTRGETSLTINGLVWMGTREKMLERINAKINAGFKTIKLKIGGIDFESEYRLIRYIRNNFADSQLTIRLDANGSFTSARSALAALDRLAPLDIHSIEQPVKARLYNEMAQVCLDSPVPVALDEELIGLNRHKDKVVMLDTVRPQYIILKPTLHGAFSGSREWIDLATERGIGWWITSALESNVGLAAIAQWTAQQGVTIPQGLGTGGLYINNVDSALTLNDERLRFNPDAPRFTDSLDNLTWITPR